MHGNVKPMQGAEGYRISYCDSDKPMQDKEGDGPVHKDEDPICRELLTDVEEPA